MKPIELAVTCRINHFFSNIHYVDSSSTIRFRLLIMMWNFTDSSLQVIQDDLIFENLAIQVILTLNNEEESDTR